MTKPETIIDLFNCVISGLADTNQRRLIVLTGEKQWVHQRVAELLVATSEQSSLKQKSSNTAQTLIVSDDMPSLNGSDYDLLSQHKLASRLGSEVQLLLWDGFCGLNPDSLGAASGLLMGGGVMLLLLPELGQLTRTPDPDYLRMCRSNDELSRCSTRFLGHLIGCLKEDASVLWYEQSPSDLSRSNRPPIHHGKVSKPVQAKALPTPDQQQCIEAISQLATSKHKLPLVIKANRGRGKSSALGIAAAKILQNNNADNFTIALCAPSQRACESAFIHFRRAYRETEVPTEQFVFYAPDELLRDQPEADILFIDEAAAIPAPMLALMVQHYRRTVFATTIHGYEGTGMGFSVRFESTLDRTRPGWRELWLAEPVRWAENDPLEPLFFRMLFLDADPAQLELPPDSVCSPDIRFYDRAELVTNSAILRQTIGLLALAHYQTSPSDIRLLLDHPEVRISIASYREQVLGVCLLLEEGGLDQPHLADGLIKGVRRPRGHLVPQNLTGFTGNATWLEASSWRIMRIAVHPRYRRQGLGSDMLAQVYQEAALCELDYIASCFGATGELLEFWRGNHFALLRIGYHLDAASGGHSAIVARAISPRSEILVQEAQTSFAQQFLTLASSHFSRLDAHLLARILGALPASATISQQERKLIESYASHFRLLEDTLLPLRKLLLLIDNETWKGLSSEQVSLLVNKILLLRSWEQSVIAAKQSGKKTAEKCLRKAIQSLLPFLGDGGIKK